MSEPSTVPSNFEEEGSSDFTPASYDIAPEDAELAENIRNFDPVYDVPPAASADKLTISRLIGGKGLDSITLNSLGPDLRQRVTERLASSPPITEKAAIAEALYQNAYEMNVVLGPGEGATPYQRAAFAVERDIYEAEQKLYAIDLEFLKAVGWENEVDERTGQSNAKQVDHMSPERRRQLSYERDSLNHRLELLNGFEGERRRQKATIETIEAQKREMRAAQIEAEANRRAEEIVFNEEVESRAAAYAKFRRTER